MLCEDKTTGHLKVKRGATIYQFPGHKTPLIHEAVVQEFGELEGEIIRVGGKDDSVPVWIQGVDGAVNKCVATKAIARELGPLINLIVDLTKSKAKVLVPAPAFTEFMIYAHSVEE